MSSLPEPQWTPVEARMLAVLADGEPHPKRELVPCLADELGSVSNIRPHLVRIRRKLRPLGLWVVCEIHKSTICYRQVRLLSARNTSV